MAAPQTALALTKNRVQETGVVVFVAADRAVRAPASVLRPPTVRSSVLQIEATAKASQIVKRMRISQIR
jgi:hypothetical protein